MYIRLHERRLHGKRGRGRGTAPRWANCRQEWRSRSGTRPPTSAWRTGTRPGPGSGSWPRVVRGWGSGRPSPSTRRGAAARSRTRTGTGPAVAATTIRGIGTGPVQKLLPRWSAVQNIIGLYFILTSYCAYNVGNGNQTLTEICNKIQCPWYFYIL